MIFSGVVRTSTPKHYVFEAHHRARSGWRYPLEFRVISFRMAGEKKNPLLTNCMSQICLVLVLEPQFADLSRRPHGCTQCSRAGRRKQSVRSPSSSTGNRNDSSACPRTPCNRVEECLRQSRYVFYVFPPTRNTQVDVRPFELCRFRSKNRGRA
jgi:hypothetical protein